MSPIGTFETSRDVRSLAAINKEKNGRSADIAFL